MRLLTGGVVLALLLTHSNQIDQLRVTAAERARAEAITRKDPTLYEQLTPDNLIVVDRRGALGSKEDRINAIRSGSAVGPQIGESHVTVREYGNLAIVLGRSVWDDRVQRNHDYFARIWVRDDGRWQMVASHRTDITAAVTAQPPRFDTPSEPIPTLPVLPRRPSDDAEQEVREAIRRQHQAYWAKDPELYRRYAGEDLQRVAENGIRGREELISMMRGNSLLPAPPSDQVDVTVRMFGSAAVGTWIDQGHDRLGRPTRSRFTVVFVHRPIGWQMVHIQSTTIRDQLAGVRDQSSRG